MDTESESGNLGDDIEKNLLQYVFLDDNVKVTEDKFIFSFEDSKPIRVVNNIFSITWIRIKFSSFHINCSEVDGLLEIPVKRYGNLYVNFTVQCQLEVNLSKKYAIVPITNEIHFENGVKEKDCVFELLDNSEFEGKKQYSISLISTMAFYGNPSVAVIDIYDNEDEPFLSFKESLFYVNESNSYYDFTVTRKGDTTKELSAMCSTSDISARGSSDLRLTSGTDYISRAISYESFITFHPGETEVSCKVKIVDDSIYEGDEEFQLILSNPHPIGRLQNPTKATVIIWGFNDASYVNIEMKEYNISREMKNFSISLIREGIDLSQPSSVRCGIKLSIRKEEEIILYHEIKFEPFQTLSKCPVEFSSHLNNSDISESFSIFLENPIDCLLGPKNNLTIHVNKEKHAPVLEFGADHIVVKETDGYVRIPILKTGDLDQNSTVICVTEDGTAKARDDYEERYQNRKLSLIHINSKEAEAICGLSIYDDEIYEGPETLKLKLMLPLKSKNPGYTLGAQKSVTLEIIDPEDATIIELEKSEYEITGNIFPNASVSAALVITRSGDVSSTSKVRISTIDGSATSGLDYYAKSKLIHFAAGEKQKKFEIEILYNMRRNWPSFFTVILGPDEIMNAEFGNISKAVVVIPNIPSSKSLILPAVPLVISLLDLGNVSRGLTQDAKSGYPLICITPCDINHPDYSVTNSLCIESEIKTASLDYQWEVSMPIDNESYLSHFERITDDTLFTSVHDKVLDSIYFRPHEKVRCIVAPKDAKGHLGIPLKSAAIKISPIAGFCLTSRRMQNFKRYFPSQSFVANLEYINSSNSEHSNRLHIHIEIPHEDGLLPLISTYPLHNIEFLLTQSVYQQQHTCSNLLQNSTRSAQTNSFSKFLSADVNDIKHAFPWYAEQIKNKTRMLYQHLDLRKCKWTFDSWYSVNELTELCGGTVTSDFKTRDTNKAYVTVVLPLYITYLFAAAPTGWTSIEHHSQLEFSFFYNMLLSKSGSLIDNSFDAALNIVRIGTNSAGQLYFEFKTEAKFYGLFVLEHYTVPGLKSHISIPDNINVQFDLQLLWTEQTLEGPSQLWKATSNYNLKDYSGNYTINLIPCKVTSSSQISLYKGHNFLPCIAQAFQKFKVPLTFQQSNRPAPVSYELETFFQIFNDENLFLQNPFNNSASYQYIEYEGAYSKGEYVYGRVFWSPEQELAPSYQLRINEVILCAAANAFLSVKETFGDMLQYGCITSNQNLRHKFILLDRNNPDAMNLNFQGIAFEAKFIDDVPGFSPLSTIYGVDGFTFKIDPLYEINANQQWFLQVMYSIKPMFKFRTRRTLDADKLLDAKEKNGTNIKRIVIKSVESSKASKLSSNTEENEVGVTLKAHHFMYLISLVLIILIIYIMTLNKPKFQKIFSYPAFFYIQCVFKKNRNVRDNNHCNKDYHRKFERKEKCRVVVYRPVEITHCESFETEV
ncbi:extracellular matrix organizing protein FRAS1-like [Uloborus diversus]|uniref:extracellular matrix organizing protein FRAS1-like n=1 Tax=Uloborus diversus TaxID=327109 RepID=UPI002409EEE4|nr:extracellular matrix organizing protein FRAS1-like [Uloborus diversus]